MMETLFDMATHAERAVRWIDDNPGGFDLFCGIAEWLYEKAKRANPDNPRAWNIGAKQVAEKMRRPWEIDEAVNWSKERGFVIDNSLVSELGRQAADRSPGLEGAFNFRRRKM